MTYGVLQLGVIIGTLLLSGWTPLENIGHHICGWHLYFGKGSNRQKLSLPAILLILSGLFLLGEQWSLSNLRTRKAELVAVHNLAGMQEMRASVLRHQRNWWLCLTAVLVWR